MCRILSLFPLDHNATNHEDNVFCLRVLCLHISWPWYLLLPTQGELMVLGSAHLVSFKVELSLVVWSLVLVLAGRALNIFPLATLCNKFRCVLKKMIWLFYQKLEYKIHFFSPGVIRSPREWWLSCGSLDSGAILTQILQFNMSVFQRRHRLCTLPSPWVRWRGEHCFQNIFLNKCLGEKSSGDHNSYCCPLHNHCSWRGHPSSRQIPCK